MGIDRSAGEHMREHQRIGISASFKVLSDGTNIDFWQGGTKRFTIVSSTNQFKILNDLDVAGTTTMVAMTTSGAVVIDLNSTEALLVRKDADAGDIFAVNTTDSIVFLPDGVRLGFGNVVGTPDATIEWNTTQTVDGLFVGLSDAQNTLIVAETGDRAFDFAHGAQTNPTLFVHSAVQNTTQWLSLAHNQTNAVLSTGAGSLTFTPAGAGLILTQTVQTSGAPTALLVTGAAHTSLTASTEVPGIDFDLDATKQWATGALTTQREIVIRAPTYGFVGASTLTTATTVEITGAPSAGTNATITNASAFTVGGASTQVSAADLVYSAIAVTPHTITVTGTTNPTGTPAFAALSLQQMTISNANAIATTNAATLHIADAPVASGGTSTITNAYSIWVEAGRCVFAGGITANNTTTLPTASTEPHRLYNTTGSNTGVVMSLCNTSTGGYSAINFYSTNGTTLEGGFGFGQSASVYASKVFFSAVNREIIFSANNSTSHISLAATNGSATFACGAVSGGVAAFTITPGAHTAVTASKSDFTLTAHTITITGGYTAQIFNVFNQATISAASALTVTTAASVGITAPTVASSALITNTNGLIVGSSITGVTVASATGATYNNLNLDAQTVSISGTTQMTGAPSVASLRVEVISLNDTADNVITVDNAASIYIAGAPAITGGSTVTLTNTYALWVDAGNVRLDGNLTFGQSSAITAGNYEIDWEGSQLHFNVPTSSTMEWSVNDVPLWVMSTSGGLTMTPSAVSGGALSFKLTPGAHTAVLAEVIDFQIADHTMTITGAYSGQTFNQIGQPTISAGSSLTVTNASTMSLIPPTVAGSANITNTRGLTIGNVITGTALTNVAGNTYSALFINDHTVTLAGTTALTTAPSITGLNIQTITVNRSGATSQADDVASLYIENAPQPADGSVTLTRSYALWVDSGISRFDGSVLIGGTAIETGSTNTLDLFSGTAPDNGVADTVILYSSDDAAGHTVPSFYCEGTNVVATGQADSVSSVRIKMRINGTVYTLLAI